MTLKFIWKTEQMIWASNFFEIIYKKTIMEIGKRIDTMNSLKHTYIHIYIIYIYI
jgi:hypothetical protein